MPINTVPERTILRALRIGVNAIQANPVVLDTILSELEPDELVKAKSYYAAHSPTVALGYPRTDTPMPCFAITLASDDVAQDYLSVGEEALLDDDDEVIGDLFKRRLRASFAIYVYADHPDICAWYYRVLRRIMGVATRYLIASHLDEPVLQGAELAPDPRYQPDNLFVRRLTLTVEYEESWDSEDALWSAYYPTPDPTFSELNIAHIDSGGGIDPATEIP